MIGLCQECLRNHSQLTATLTKDFIDRLASGDLQLEVELQAAITEKDPSYTIRDNPTIASILNQHGSLVATASPSLLTQAASALDEQGFELLKKEIAYEQQCVRVWYSKMSSYLAGIHHQSEAWKHSVFQKNAAL